mgnify:CR=1 FL=1
MPCASGSDSSLLSKGSRMEVLSVSETLSIRSISGYYLKEVSSVNMISASPRILFGSHRLHLTHLDFRFCFVLTMKNDSSRLIR